MSLVTEVFGMDILQSTKAALIARIQRLPPTQDERRTYLLHDWSAATGEKLTAEDFAAVSTQA